MLESLVYTDVLVSHLHTTCEVLSLLQESGTTQAMIVILWTPFPTALSPIQAIMV